MFYRKYVFDNTIGIDKDAHAVVSPSSYMAMLSTIAKANCGKNCK